MKRIYLILVAIIAFSAFFSSCTEEMSQPRKPDGNGQRDLNPKQFE